MARTWARLLRTGRPGRGQVGSGPYPPSCLANPAHPTYLPYLDLAAVNEPPPDTVPCMAVPFTRARYSTAPALNVI